MHELMALFLAFVAASGNNVGKALQKEGTLTLPRLTLKRSVLLEYARNATWAAGLACDVGGALLMVVAVANAPVSLVQPVAGAGLAVLALYAHCRLDERLSQADWLAVASTIAGTVGTGLTADETADQEPPLPGAAQLMGCAALVAVMLYGCHWWLEGNTGAPPSSAGMADDEVKVHGRPAGGAVGKLGRQVAAAAAGARGELNDIVAGVRAGAFFGVSACSTRLGFMAADAGKGVLCAMAGIGASVVLSGAGFFYQTRAFKEGRAISVATSAAVSNIFFGITIGLMALGERLPASGGKRFLRFVSWTLLCVGIGIIARGATAQALASDKAGTEAKLEGKRFAAERRGSAPFGTPGKTPGKGKGGAAKLAMAV